MEQGSYNFHYGFPTPGPQEPDVAHVFEHIFFEPRADWKDIKEFGNYNYVVIGSGFCGLAFVDRILQKDPNARVLMLEQGGHFLPEHFQNLPPVYKATLPNQIFQTETYPWTVQSEAAQRKNGASWMHGAVPFFGGRSTLWSGWCPIPKSDLGELRAWDPKIIEMMEKDPNFFKDAEELLGVIHADEIDETRNVKDHLKIFWHAQDRFQNILEKNFGKIEGANRAIPSPLAIADQSDFRAEFTKFSVNGKLLSMLKKDEENAVLAQKEYFKNLLSLNSNNPENIKMKPLHNFRRFIVKTECAVDQIYFQKTKGQNIATALNTNQGVVPLVKIDDNGNKQDVEVVLAMGCMPAATLILNSIDYDLNYPNRPGSTFGAHYITAITARVPLSHFEGCESWNQLEIGDDLIITTAQRFMPDVVSTASPLQLSTSQKDGGYVIFVFAALGEMDVDNPDNSFNLNPKSSGEKTSNCTLSWSINERDEACWDEMDSASFQAIKELSSGGEIQYWKGGPDDGEWVSSQEKFRVPGMVHESSVMQMGSDDTKYPVDLEFRVRKTNNVYVTGSSLWPTAGSWNPTLTMCGLAQKLADQRAEAKK